MGIAAAVMRMNSNTPAEPPKSRTPSRQNSSRSSSSVSSNQPSPLRSGSANMNINALNSMLTDNKPTPHSNQSNTFESSPQRERGAARAPVESKPVHEDKPVVEEKNDAEAKIISADNIPQPIGLTRAREWSPEVEEAFRFQETGWRDIYEYRSVYGEPVRWPNGFLRTVRVKKNGYFTYWNETKECEDKFLARVKMYTYE
eukprot:TRINITY_DN6181_c0_g2_i2.p1 TRINITY_DN6181_c0_g2~~TRINITY_DN6181_c0_g2_i2.p1  ORF type:complete len:201 (+),score=37.61 TRINITY_DN6181_c0_g2_i2:161-763(+)